MADAEADVTKYTQYAEAAVRVAMMATPANFWATNRQAAAKLTELQAVYQRAKETPEKNAFDEPKADRGN